MLGEEEREEEIRDEYMEDVGVGESEEQQEQPNQQPEQQQEKLTQLPISRIKAIARSDPEVNMVNAEAALLLTKATELFVMHMTEAAHQQTQAARPKRKTVQNKDILDLVSYRDEFQFLHDRKSGLTRGKAKLADDSLDSPLTGEKDEASDDAGPIIEAFPRLSVHDFESGDRVRSLESRKQQRRRSYRYPVYGTSSLYARPHQSLAKAPQESEEEDQHGPHHHRHSEELGAGRVSFDYGCASAVLSFSLSKGETLYDVLPNSRGGGTTLRPVSGKGTRPAYSAAHSRHRGSSGSGRSSNAHVDIIALIHELEARELPCGDQPEKSPLQPIPDAASAQPMQPYTAVEAGQERSAQEFLEELESELSPEERKEVSHYESVFFYGKSELSRTLPTSATKRGRSEYQGDAGDHIHYRYEIVKLVGKGTFGKVFSAIDHKTGEKVAVKVIRNALRYMRQGLKEVKLLETLQREDLQDEHHLVRFFSSFTFRSHLCLVFELMDESLYDHLSKLKSGGMPLIRVKAVTRQILKALSFLAERAVVHCDVKPENVMVCTATWRVKLIDFGTSCLTSSTDQNTYIQSRFYRAPEVILGLRYSCAIDMWSLGCMLPELLNNQVLFPGENERQQIATFCATLGIPPASLLKESSRANIYFLKNTCKLISFAAAYGVIRTPGSFPLAEIVPDATTDFLDFLSCCLSWDPTLRMTANEGLKHNWMVATPKVGTAKARGKLPSIVRSS